MSTVHFYKENFLKILDCKYRETAKKAMMNWLTGILNSFTTITNGFTEQNQGAKAQCIRLQKL